ncbi:hypothetical protein AVEN_20616-1, partial [Araneus ventricosus]
MKLVSVTQVYLVTKKIEPSLVAVLLLTSLPNKISLFSFLAPSFLLSRPPPGGTVQKTFPQIHVHFVSGVHLIERLLAPYLFWACPFVASGFS